MPWADGTECATNYWCQRGVCVPRDRMALVKVDGSWGEWKPLVTAITVEIMLKLQMNFK